jgi:hypothetical protein
MAALSIVAPEFVQMAHRIVWCTVATVSPDGSPRSRVLHPIWEFDGERLTGWVATSPQSPKATDLAHEARVSLTYWSPDHDTCTADCSTEWEHSPAEREQGWRRFADAPAPVGYDPSIIPGWTAPDSPGFGMLRLEPVRLRVMPGSLMMSGQGRLLTWKKSD